MKKRTKRLLLGAVVAAITIGVAVYAVYSYELIPAKKKIVKTVGKTTTESPTSKKSTPAETPAVNVELATYTNSRYGFSVGYPAKWQANPSQNGDGAVFTDPSGTPTNVRVFGAMTTTFTMADIIAARETLYKETYSDVKKVAENEITVDDHPATTVIWEYSKDVPMREKTLFTYKGDAIICVEFAVPKDKYDSYSPTIDAMLTSIKVK